MALRLDSENANFNLTSTAKTVLTHTPDANHATLCQVLLKLGDGVDDLDGTGGDFSFTIEVGGQVVGPQVITLSTDVRQARWSTAFVVPSGDQVVVKLLSPNGADTDVDITAELYQVGEVTPKVRGKVDDATPAATGFEGDAGLSATDDAYVDMALVFLTGANAGIPRKVADYTGASNAFDFTGDPFPTAPANGDLFEIIGLIK